MLLQYKRSKEAISGESRYKAVCSVNPEYLLSRLARQRFDTADIAPVLRASLGVVLATGPVAAERTPTLRLVSSSTARSIQFKQVADVEFTFETSKNKTVTRNLRFPAGFTLSMAWPSSVMEPISAALALVTPNPGTV